jgi:hypothetical protein
MIRVIGGKRYDTEKAQLLASDRYWDGNNWERHGRNTFLYRTAKGNCFIHRTTLWQGERDSIEAVDEARARALYEELPEHDVDFEEAFPGALIEEA